MNAVEDAYPLNTTHSGILFHSLQGEEDVYVSTISLRITGKLDVDTLQQAWQRVFTHHPSLRSGIVVDGLDEPLWVVNKSINPEWQILDHARLSETEREAEERNLVETLQKTRFGFAADTLMRFTLIAHSEQRHRLLWTVHHIVSDGWSTSVVIEDLAQAYKEALESKPSTLRAALPYRDFLSWQSQLDLTPLKAYWSNYLAGVIPSDLALSEPLLETADRQAIETRVELSQKLSLGINELARHNKTTGSAVLLAAWGLLLRDLCQQDSPMYGVTVAGRPAHLPNIDRSVGLYIATLPYICRISSNDTIEQWLQTTAKTLQKHAEHDALPIAELQKLIDREDSQPLFSTVVAIEGHEGGLSFGSTDDNSVVFDSIDYKIRSHFDLSLLITPSERTSLNLISQSASIDETANKRLLVNFQQIIELLTSNTCDTVNDLMNRWNEVKRQSLTQIQQTKTHTPYSRIDQWISDAAQRYINRPALIQGERSLTYQVLLDQATAVSQGINTQLKDSSHAIAICLPNGIDAVVAILGVLLSGRYYVPMDYEQPKQRQTKLYNDAQCALMITVQADKNNPYEVTLEELVSSGTSSVSTSTSEISTTGETPAYMIFTSGSTGTPKGVIISHANLLYSTQARCDFYKSPVKRFLLVSPLHFDSSVVGLFWTLCTGGTLVMPEYKHRREVARWLELVSHHDVTHCLLLPGLYRLLLSQKEQSKLDSLKTVIVAGEACDADLCSNHYDCLPDTQLYNEYGPTEACVWSSVHHCQPLEPNAVPIGKPIPGTAIDIVGFDGASCVDGVEGELVIKSAGVALGYFNQTQSSRQVFLTNPTAYKTGDLGYRSANGNYYCTGRIDRQLKIRGQRIEPAEIESVARNVNLIEQVHAFTVKSAEGRQRLWLAYTPTTVDQAELIHRLSTSLPSAMRPQEFIALDSLPVLPNGKLSGKALTELAINSAGNSTEDVIDNAAVFTATASSNIDDIAPEVLETVRAMLKTNTIALEDNLLHHGMDSLDAMRLTTRLRGQFDVDLQLASVLEEKSVNDLIDHIQQIKGNSHTEVAEESTIAANDIPLSSTQMQLWFLEQVGLDANVYAVESSLRCRGTVSIDAITYAANALICRHEILRTRLRINELGEPQQAVLEAEPVDITVVDGRNNAVAWEELRSQQLNRPFDLEIDQLIRVLVYRYSDDEYNIMFSSHHIVLDGWSFDLLHQQLAHYYNDYVTQHATDAKLLSMQEVAALHKPDEHQYQSYARWEASSDTKQRQADLDFWLNQLAQPHEALTLPIDLERPDRLSYRGGSVVNSINNSTIEQWNEIALSAKTTMFTVALASLKTALRTVTDNSELMVGTPVANRDDARWQQTMGFFSNTVVIRTAGDASDSFTQSVSNTKHAVLDALRHQSTPVGEIVQKLNLKRSRNRHPLFEVLFVFKQSPADVPRLNGMSVEMVDDLSLDGAKYDIAVEIRPVKIQGTLQYRLHLNYSKDLFSDVAAQELCTQLLSVITETARSPNSSVEQLLSDSSQALAVSQQGAMPAKDDLGLLVNQRLDEVFKARCKTAGTQTALHDNNISIDYAELSLYVDRITDHLHSLGIQPGDVVALSLPRSIELIAATLAVSRCNAVWCPIDPVLPDTRKQYIISDSDARFMILNVTSSNAEIVKLASHHSMVFELANSTQCVELTIGSIAINTDVSRKQSRVSSKAAVLLYTSGSTGKPKGVLIGHAALMNRLVWMWRRYPFSSNDVNIIKTSSGFVDSLWESFGGLLEGVPSVIVAESDVIDIERFISILNSHKVTRLLLVPSLLTALLDRLDADKQTLHHLKLLSCSGETLPSQLANRAFARLPHIRLLNLYGCTEITADVSCQEITPSSTDGELPIGSAIDGIRLHILDQHNKLLPVGKTGQIAASGVGLALGYHKDESLTTSRYISVQGIGRVFLTGDEGWIDGYGQLHYIGRSDRQIKVRGVRINCQSLEIELSQLGGVARCHVFAAGELDERRLCAVVQFKPNSMSNEAVQIEQLKQLLLEKVPHNLVPDVWLAVDKLPMLANGKLDKVTTESLIDINDKPAPIHAKRALDSNAHKLIENDLSESLLEIWRSSLGFSQLNTDDCFFESGGYSLLAVKVVNRMNKDVLAPHGMSVSIGDLLELRTINQIVERLQRSQQTDDVAANAYLPNPLMNLQNGSGEKRIFLVPPFGYSGLYANNLLPHVPSSVHLHSFDTTISINHSSMEELSKVLVDSVLSVQPNGPWVITALCYGNIIAFEMARQLKLATGQDCELYLVDSGPPMTSAAPAAGQAPTSKAQRYWSIFKTEFKRDYLKHVVRKNVKKLRGVFDAEIQQYIDVQIAQGHHFESYMAEPGSANITLVRSRGHMDKPEYTQSWKQLTTGEFKTVDLPMLTHEQLTRSQSPRWDLLAPAIMYCNSKLDTQNMGDNDEEQLSTDGLV